MLDSDETLIMDCLIPSSCKGAKTQSINSTLGGLAPLREAIDQPPVKTINNLI